MHSVWRGSVVVDMLRTGEFCFEASESCSSPGHISAAVKDKAASAIHIGEIFSRPAVELGWCCG